MAGRALPQQNGSTAPKSTNPPNQTLYLTNLPEKISKSDLRLSLYTLFATYGPVLDVNAVRSNKMRGQAHIAFRDIATATQAMRSLQGFDFFGKNMTVQYARGKSDVVAKLDGTYRMPAPGGQGTGTMGSDLQQQIFGGVPGVVPPKATDTAAEVTAEGTKGVKRGREEEEDDSDEGAPMEEDSDAPMEEGSDDED